MTAGITRLKKRADFLRISASGIKAVRPGFILQVDLLPHDFRTVHKYDIMRVGFTVTKRVGKAVIRNRVRRRLRALAKDVLQHYGTPALDYVLIGRKATLGQSYQMMRKDLVKALRKIHANNNPIYEIVKTDRNEKNYI